MNIPFIRQLVGAAGAVVLLVCAVPAGTAQQGAIAGRVTDQAGQQPVPGAQVLVEGTTRLTLTDRDGRFRFDNLTAGQYRLQVRLIGYATAARPVSVGLGETAQLDFVLSAAAVPLEAITVTATGEELRARELGNAPSHIDAAKVAQQAPVTDFTDLINARAPGLTVLPSSGTTGSGTRVRIRGATSLSLSNEPVIVVDGIRVENRATSNSTGTGVGGQVPSRLNDIDPADIETIEVQKGPAASSLYGTDAVNGVIQTRTKQGRPGPTRWEAYVEGGVLNDVTDWPANYQAQDAAGNFCPLSSATRVTPAPCVQSKLLSFNPLKTYSPFREGVRQEYGLSASGGSEQTTYYVAGHFNREKGDFVTNDLRRVSLRANVKTQTSQKLDLAVATGYTSSNLRLPENDNNALGILPSGLLGSADSTLNKGYGFLLPEQTYFIDARQGIERYTGSAQANFRPWSFLSLHGIAGTDVTNRFDQKTFPPGLVPLNQNTLDGSRQANRFQTLDYTAQLAAVASFRLSPDVNSSSSAGVQYFKDRLTGTIASGRKLVAGTTSLAGVIIPSVNEQTSEFVTLGYYVTEQVGWRDRRFITGALRSDRNSAFGKNFGNILYPKIAASWVMSEEPFFPRSDLVNSVRLRAAFGRSGRQPGPTDAVEFFSPVAVSDATVDVPGITDSSLGNANLRPERTEEIEAGFDADLWRQRFHLEFTAYGKKSKDALVARNLAPSLGVSSQRFENLGQVSNVGVELLLNAQVVKAPHVTWDLTLSMWGNRNRLDVLGPGIAPIIFGLGGASQRHTEGFPLGSYFMVPYTYADTSGDGILSTREVTLGTTPVFLGTPLPTHGATLSSEASIGPHVRVYGLLDGRWGNKLFNSTEQFRCGFGICRGRNDKTASLTDQARAIANLLGTQAGYVEDAGFVKLREVSVSFFAPQEWAHAIRANALSLTVSGRNLATWTNYTGADPELNQFGQSPLFGGAPVADFLTQPPVRYFIARVNVSF